MIRQEELWAGYYKRKKEYEHIVAMQDKIIADNFKIIEIMQNQIKAFTQNNDKYGKDNNK